MEEIWKPIAGYEGRYEVSNLGRIKSLAHDVEQLNKYGTVSITHRKERIIIARCNYHGYPYVTLWYGIRKKSYSVHHLVATAFLPNPDNLPCVNHKDEDKTNNHVENLEWCNHKYNNCYGTRLSRIIDKNKRPVAKYDTDGRLIATYPGVKDAAKDSTVSWQMISACLTRPNIRTAGGYIYKYIEKEK